MSNIAVDGQKHFTISSENLTLYEVQRPYIEPILRWGRLWNTALDVTFYDVGVLTASLLTKGTVVDTLATVKANAPTRTYCRATS